MLVYIDQEGGGAHGLMEKAGDLQVSLLPLVYHQNSHEGERKELTPYVDLQLPLVHPGKGAPNKIKL